MDFLQVPLFDALDSTRFLAELEKDRTKKNVISVKKFKKSCRFQIYFINFNLVVYFYLYKTIFKKKKPLSSHLLEQLFRDNIVSIYFC